MLVSELIASSMRLIGTLASGETPSTDESADVFAALNQMLSSWSTEQVNLYTVAQASMPLTNNVGTYPLLGHPVLLRSASMVTAQNLRIPIDIINSTEYAAILERGQAAQIVRKLYCDYAWPTASLFVSPVPNAGGSIEYWAWYALNAFLTQQDQVSFPPGYIQALRYNLAVAIAPEFGMAPDAAVAAIAGQSKAALRALNAQYLSGAVAIDANPGSAGAAAAMPQVIAAQQPTR
jgi:hypothetical protein